MSEKKVKALVLLSGGLDSMLAVKVLQNQGIEVTGITFESNFYNAEKSRKAVEQLDIPLKVVDIRKEMLDLVKNPPSGHGKHMNPCIDCHSLMIRKASEFLKNKPHSSPLLENERGLFKILKASIFRPSSLLRRRTGGGGDFDIIATGEVAGQRPFSQTKQALERVRKYSGVEVLRPLSAKLLSETEYEKKGLVDRNKLLDIEGRGRSRQMELTKKYGIKEYPGPGGGCILTESGFGDRLRKMIENWPDCDMDDVELLKYGRVYWIYDKILMIVGRKQEDNENLERLAKEGDMLVEIKDVNGPITLVRIKNEKLKIKNDNIEISIPEELNVEEELKSREKPIEIAGVLTGWHAPKARGKSVNLQLRIIN